MRMSFSSTQIDDRRRSSSDAAGDEAEHARGRGAEPERRRLVDGVLALAVPEPVPVAARAAQAGEAVAVAAERAEEAQAVRARRAALPRPQHRQPQQPPRPRPERRRRLLPRRHCACASNGKRRWIGSLLCAALLR